MSDSTVSGTFTDWVGSTLSGTQNVDAYDTSGTHLGGDTAEAGVYSYTVTTTSGTKVLVVWSYEDYYNGYTNLAGANFQVTTYAAPAAGNRGVMAGGHPYGPGWVNIEYITINTPGNSTVFGDLQGSNRFSMGACSNGITGDGIFGGGYYNNDTIDHVEIMTTGNSTDWGNLTVGRRELEACDNNTGNRGVFAGGYLNQNVIDYITVSSDSGATDFGDLMAGHQRQLLTGTSNGTNNRGVWGGGTYTATQKNYIDYITITSTGNSQDFGDLTEEVQHAGACSNGTSNRGLWGGGYKKGGFGSSDTDTINYINIASTGDASDFGNLVNARRDTGAVDNATGDRGVFIAGRVGATAQETMDYVTISTPGNATNFGDTADPTYWFEGTSNG